mgnify:CR=1 FL=1
MVDTPIVGTMQYSMVPNNEWGWFDFLTGSLIGLYGSLNVRQRNYDCFGRTFNFVI